MKILMLAILCFSFVACSGDANNTTETNTNTATTTADTDNTITDAADAPVMEINAKVVEASCGQCKFGLKGNGCDLAIRVDGKAYFVDGAKIDDHGDAHADHGFCNAIRQAKVDGKVEKGRFLATNFELMPVEETSTTEEHDHTHEEGHNHKH